MQRTTVLRTLLIAALVWVLPATLWAHAPRNSFWVFAAGLTNVEVDIVVTDTQTGQMRVYDNDLGTDFEPVLDTQAFLTCP